MPALELFTRPLCRRCVRSLDYLAVPRAVLFGLSMGGYVGLAFSAKYRDSLKALVLADTRAQADSPEGRLGRFHLAETAFNQGARAVAEVMLPKLLGSTSLQSKHDLVEYVRRTIHAAPVSGIIVDLMAIADRPDSVRPSAPSPVPHSL